MKDNKDVAKGWIRKAESDIENLRTMMEKGTALAYFHAQQAAEKYLKGFLSFNGVVFPRTHDIEELLDLCATIDGRFSDLTRDGISYRLCCGITL